jgi:transitional endoplasmic reticulum ATPase
MDAKQMAVLATLEELGGKLTADDDVVRTDDMTFAIPQGMDVMDAARFLASKAEEENKTTRFNRTFAFRPWDGALATHNVLKRVFGMVRMDRAQMIEIPSGVDQTTEVPWGTFAIPVLPDTEFNADSDWSAERGMVFELSARGPRKDRHAVAGVFALVQSELEQNSLYRGKAFDGQSMPTFVDVASVDRAKIIYSQGTEEQISANVWSLLRFTRQHREMGLPLKRAVLFEGPYGTGKTVGATITAQEAVANGWTFIYCRPGRDDLSECMMTAKLYQPAVVFVEDVDGISDPETSGVDGVSRLLDLFDGMATKDTEIMIVMTTNHPEKIHKGMVRPGRLDAVIHVGHLDADGIERMTRVLIPTENLSPDVHWESVTDAMAGFLPAYIKEAVDRARRYNLARNNGVPSVIGTDDLVAAAVGLHPQLALMQEAKEGPTLEPLSKQLANVVAGAVSLPDVPSIGQIAESFGMVMSDATLYADSGELYMDREDGEITGELRLRL